jgi:hypothetical protein
VRKLGQDAKRRGGATIVEVDEQVVGDNRHRSVSAELLLERGDPQSQVELIAGAVAHSFDRHLVAPTSSDQHQLALLVVPRCDPLERANGEERKQLVCALDKRARGRRASPGRCG